MLNKINKKSVRLRELAYKEIRSSIMEGNLKPGDPLIEMELSDKLGVSRTPLREALALLEHEGLIETIPYKGTFVASLDRRTFEEILDIRLILECHAIELAVGKIPLEKLKDLEYELQSGILSQDQWLSILTSGNKLHQIISHFSGNQTLENLITVDIERIHQYFAIHKVKFDLQHLREEILEHTAIVQSLIEENANEAKRRMQIHLENSHRRTLTYFQ